MALVTCEYFSELLGMMRSMRVILPQEGSQKNWINGEHARHGNLPVLYLLNGLSDNDSAWVRRTSIERYAMKWGIAVVMPNGERSWYTDAVAGHKFYSHIAYEVPKIAQSLFPLSTRREDNFIAGISMGGYGALKIGLQNPHMYSAVASLSGALDLGKRNEGIEDKAFLKELGDIFGSIDNIANSENDLISLLGKVDSETAPQILQCCGTEDFLYGMNTLFHKKAVEKGFDVTYWEGAGGHTWEYWDSEIQSVLRKLRIPLK